MSENTTDNLNALQKPDDNSTKPLWWFVYVHYSLVVLATLPFLFCLVRVVMPPVNIKIVPAPGWPEVLLIVGFIGLLFRKKMAYMFFVIISLIAEALLIVSPSAWQATEFVVLAIWFGLILLSALICGLTCNPKSTGDKPVR